MAWVRRVLRLQQPISRFLPSVYLKSKYSDGAWLDSVTAGCALNCPGVLTAWAQKRGLGCVAKPPRRKSKYSLPAAGYEN
jgi:hypothetical protein